jgi:hypothetical protein
VTFVRVYPIVFLFFVVQHRSSGYPAAGYPTGYPGQQPGFMNQGSGGGGLLGGLGTAMGAAALGTALLNPVSVLTLWRMFVA